MREKGRAAIYSMAGIYLLIMDYNIWNNLSGSSGYEYLLMFIFAIVFIIAGVGLIGFGAFMTHSFYKKSKEAVVQSEEVKNRKENVH